MKKTNFIILTVLLLFLLVWRFKVSTIRFFDVDEFSYLHWTAQIARGERQYVDFYSYFTPGFFWLFTPIFWIYGVSANVLVAGRMLALGIFLGILGLLGVLWRKTRDLKWTLLPVVILAFLPMPYDKFLEIRPDNLATLLAVVGIIAEVQALQAKNKVWWFITGMVYSSALFVLVKVLPIVAVGSIIALIALRKHIKEFLFFVTGLSGLWFVFFFVHAIIGDIQVVWYSLTKLVFEAAHGAPDYIIMVQNLFFNPNAAFYGGTGYTITTALLVNNVLWIVAIIFGAYRLFTPFIKRQPFTEILVAGSFFISVIAYVKFFPLKHSQYLIPTTVFVAYYAADGLSIFFDWIARIGGKASLVIILVGFVYLFVAVTQDVNKPKLANTNTAQIAELIQLIQTIPRSARVVDLEGKMLFWQEGYPICCIPYDLGLPYWTEGPPPLAIYLESRPADYVYDGDSTRLALLSSSNQAFIKKHFSPVPGWGERLWKRIP